MVDRLDAVRSMRHPPSYGDNALIKRSTDAPMFDGQFCKMRQSAGAALRGCGGHARNRTGVRGFAVRYVTTPPRGQSAQRRSKRTGNAPCNIRIGDWKVRATAAAQRLGAAPRPHALSRFAAYSAKLAASTRNLDPRGNDGRRRHAAHEHGREPGPDERRDRPAHPAGHAPDSRANASCRHRWRRSPTWTRRCR